MSEFLSIEQESPRAARPLLQAIRASFAPLLAPFRPYTARLKKRDEAEGSLHDQDLDEIGLARETAGADARLSRRGQTCRRRGPACQVSAAGLCGRGAQAEKSNWRWPVRARRSVAGRRLRRKLCRIQRGQHPRHVPGAASDGHRPDLWRKGAGHQSGPDGGPVRQAPLRPDRGDRRRGICQLPRRHHQTASRRRPSPASPIRRGCCRPTRRRRPA